MAVTRWSAVLARVSRGVAFVLLSALIAASSLLAPTAARAGPKDPPDVERLLERLDELYRSKSSIARIEIHVTTPRSTRSLRLRAWTRGEDEALIVIEAPPREQGT